jgi:hypothetical protein
VEEFGDLKDRRIQEGLKKKRLSDVWASEPTLYKVRKGWGTLKYFRESTSVES